MTLKIPDPQGLLVLPHLRIQNANAISSPLTHGFPGMTAFLGLMWALERKLASRQLPITFDGVGVICHDYQELTTEGGYTRAFRLTRNPVDSNGDTAAIVEEGRIHLEITLVFGASGGFVELDQDRRQEIANAVAETVSGMRIAGGSVVPGTTAGWRTRPMLETLSITPDDAAKQFRFLRRRWLPGFALVGRDDLLHRHQRELEADGAPASTLDAWLDLSRFNWHASAETGTPPGKVRWAHDRPEGAGWIVPIPVGYGTLAEHGPGEVANARDPRVPFAFAESLYSIGQWIGPHRLQSWRDLLWHAHHDSRTGVYRVRNHYAPLVIA
jgi:CRISPR-associated protein Csy2